MSVIEVIERLKAKNGFLNELLDIKTFTQFKRYIAIGVLSFILEYGLFLALYKVVELWYVTANFLVYFAAFWFNFILNRVWTFGSKDSLRKQLVLYGILFSFNMLIITVLIVLFSDTVGFSPPLSKVIVMGIIVPWNFIIYKKVIYKPLL